jgi:hypothetical protein
VTKYCAGIPKLGGGEKAEHLPPEMPFLHSFAPHFPVHPPGEEYFFESGDKCAKQRRQLQYSHSLIRLNRARKSEGPVANAGRNLKSLISQPGLPGWMLPAPCPANSMASL